MPPQPLGTLLQRTPRLYSAVLAAMALLGIVRLLSVACPGFQTRPDVLLTGVALGVGSLLLIYGALGEADTHRTVTAFGAAAFGASLVGTMPAAAILAFLGALRVAGVEHWRIARVALVAVIIVLAYGAPVLAQQWMTESQFTCTGVVSGWSRPSV